jgi:hypothetical protein
VTGRVLSYLRTPFKAQKLKSELSNNRQSNWAAKKKNYGPWRPIGLWDVGRGSHICFYNRLTDGGEVVSLTRRPSFTPQEDSWYSFLLEAESTPAP